MNKTKLNEQQSLKVLDALTEDIKHDTYNVKRCEISECNNPVPVLTLELETKDEEIDFQALNDVIKAHDCHILTVQAGFNSTVIFSITAEREDLRDWYAV